MVRHAHDAGAEADVVRVHAGGGEEHLGRGDHLPAGRVVLTAPELLEAEPVEVHREVEVALELQRRVLAGGVVRCEERAELDSSHGSRAYETAPPLLVPCNRRAELPPRVITRVQRYPCPLPEGT